MNADPRLNGDVCHRVLSLLDAEDLAQAGATCRLWREAASHPLLWRRFLDAPLSFAATRAAPPPDRSPRLHFLVRAAWSAAAATERRVRTPHRPSVTAVADCSRNGFAVAVAGAAEARPAAHDAATLAAPWRTPVTVYCPCPGALRAVTYASTLHHAGAQPVCVRICPGQSCFLLAYAYADGTIALYTLPTAPAEASFGALAETELLWRSDVLAGERIAAIDLNEEQVVVGTESGNAVMLTGVGLLLTWQLGPSKVTAVRAGHSFGSGLAGTANGEVVAFDAAKGPNTLTRYVGPSGHPIGAVTYGASGGLIIATYLETTQHSLPPVATAWDAHSGRRVGSFAATRMRRRRTGAARGVAVGAPDATGSDSKIGVLVGGAVLVYDVRRMTEAVVEVGDDTVSVAMLGDRLVVGESTAVHGRDCSEHSVRCLDFAEAARMPAHTISRFAPASVGSDSPWRPQSRTLSTPGPQHASSGGQEGGCGIRT